MNKIIIPTGYMLSGSSAITDIVREFRGYNAMHNDFEYVFLHCPDGLFDLEDKLLVNNNAIRSDEALRSFRAAMSELFDKPFWWPGNYQKHLSSRFMDITDAFIESLTQFRSSNYWYYQEQRGIRALPKLVFNKAIRTLTRNQICPSMPLRYQGMLLSLPSTEEFYKAAKDYLDSLWHELGIEEGNLVLDQLLLPFNLWRFDNYFLDNAECFVVERDPRDTFLLNKYVCGQKYSLPVPFPTDVEEFCQYYLSLRNSEKIAKSPHVHRIKFEDLIYRYEETLEQIMNTLSLSPLDHELAQHHFNPQKSMNNTQLFLDPQFASEVSRINELLAPYLYDFPYPISHDDASIF